MAAYEPPAETLSKRSASKALVDIYCEEQGEADSRAEPASVSRIGIEATRSC
jgi:hypothetical protein